MSNAERLKELIEQAERAHGLPVLRAQPTKTLLKAIDSEIIEPLEARIAELEAENARLTELLRGDRMIVATRINHELTTARRRNIELEAAINGCAGQWTPMQDGAHYCGCNEEDCAGEWRIENNGSRLVVGDGENELSVEFYDAIRVCWQIQPSTGAQP